MLPLIWFCMVAATIAGYVVLDGFDLGAGAIHLLVAKTPEERRQVLRSIGPVWDGNEVWLLAAGGTLYFAFPALYAASFSGFYLPLTMVLWLLILRGVSIEFRNHIDSPVWTPLWDAGFGVSSALLAVFFGAALGNVVRGVPLSAGGDFFLPLWTDFVPGANPGILDWYTVLIGVLAAVALAAHGALWVRYKTDAELSLRARRFARGAWWVLGGLSVAATAASFWLQPQIPANFRAHPWGVVFPILALYGFAGTRWMRTELGAFLSSCVYLAGMLTSAAFGVFPYVLPAVGAAERGLTIYNTAPAAYGLRIGLAWWIPGMALAAGYTMLVYRRFAGKVR
jgi:cytochrome bd ubiquinol oxidase subunit II